MKTSNLSLESDTLTTSPYSSSSVWAGREEVTTLVVCCDGRVTFGIPSGIGSVVSVPSGIGPLMRNLGAVTLNHCKRGSFAFITHLGARKLLDIGV